METAQPQFQQLFLFDRINPLKGRGVNWLHFARQF